MIRRQLPWSAIAAVAVVVITTLYVLHAHPARSQVAAPSVGVISAPSAPPVTALFLKPAEMQGNAVRVADYLGRYAGGIWAANLLGIHNADALRIYRTWYPDRWAGFYLSSDTARRRPRDEFGYFPWSEVGKREDWFLRADRTRAHAPDNRIPVNAAEPDRWMLDVANREFVAWAAAYLAEQVGPYSGVAFDNVHLNVGRWRAVTRKYPRWEYAHRENEFQGAFLSYLASVRRALPPGKTVVTNASLKADVRDDLAVLPLLCRVVDGVMLEHHQPAPTEAIRQAHAAIRNMGRLDWWAVYPRAAAQFTAWWSTFQNDRGPTSLWWAARGSWSYYNNPVPAWYEQYER